MKRLSQILVFGLVLMTLPASAQAPGPGLTPGDQPLRPASELPLGLEDVGFDFVFAEHFSQLAFEFGKTSTVSFLLLFYLL